MIRTLLLAALIASSLWTCGGGGGGETPTTPSTPTGGGDTTTPTPPPPPPEPVEVSVVGTGAFFQSVVVTVTGPWDGEYTASVGNVTETDTGLEIRSDGRIGRGELVIDEETYYYDIVEDPKCLNGPLENKYKVDCEGYLVGARAASMIWYGEEDTQIVDIELGIYRSMSRCNVDPCVEHESIPEGNEIRVAAEEWIEEINEFNTRSKVYIRFVLTDIMWREQWQDVFSFGGGGPLAEISDVVLGWGGSGSNHGQALMPVSIYPTMKTPAPVALAIGGTALHELGHAMSLGHGVWGDPDWTLETVDLGWQGGGIFPRFGHGWSGKSGEGTCGSQGSVMSYGSKAHWTNSLLSCEELGYSPGNWGDAAGSRQQSDEAYALNRIRYSYSLIHNEHLTQ